MGKVAAWRPVRRGKNDRALTRYKSHYGVNLLDPSPPTDFQPPGTMLGCRLWATSHANSDKVPTVSLSILPTLYLFLFLSNPISRSRCLRCRRPILVAFRLFCSYPSLFFSLPPCLPGFIRQAIPTRGIPEAPQPPRTRAREYLSPGHLRAD